MTRKIFSRNGPVLPRGIVSQPLRCAHLVPPAIPALKLTHDTQTDKLQSDKPQSGSKHIFAFHHYSRNLRDRVNVSRVTLIHSRVLRV